MNDDRVPGGMTAVVLSVVELNQEEVEERDEDGPEVTAEECRPESVDAFTESELDTTEGEEEVSEEMPEVAFGEAEEEAEETVELEASAEELTPETLTVEEVLAEL